MSAREHDRRAARLLERGSRLIRVSVAGVRGSAPREVGATMWVSETDTWGTIGGGQLEYLCTRTAAERLRHKPSQGDDAFLRRFPLGADCGQCCGGVVDVLFDEVHHGVDWFERWIRYVRESRACAVVTRYDGNVFRRRVVLRGAEGHEETAALQPALERAFTRGQSQRVGRSRDGFTLVEPYVPGRFPVAVFGAGHVGSALIEVLRTLDADIRWIDSRAGALPTTLPGNVQALLSAAPANEVAALPPAAYYLVMTHSHALDYDICCAALRRADAAYVGLIGSRSKRRRFLKRFERDGVEAAALTCPIGVPDVDGKRPAEIAIAVAAELLQHRSRSALPASVKSLHRQTG